MSFPADEDVQLLSRSDITILACPHLVEYSVRAKEKPLEFVTVSNGLFV